MELDSESIVLFFLFFVFCLIFVKNQLDSLSLVDKDHFIPLMSEWMNPLTLFGFFLLSVKGQICLVCSIEFNLMGQTVVKRPQIFHFFSLPQSTSVADLFLVSWTDTVYIQNLFYYSLFYASYCSIILYVLACHVCVCFFLFACQCAVPSMSW